MNRRAQSGAQWLWFLFESLMNEFVVKLADERGRVQEQTHAAATAEELRGSVYSGGILRL